jgi:tetratricopeptide (TPR) repeat protein
MAMAHFQLEQLDASLEHAEKAVDLSDEPGEGFLQLLAALYTQEEDYESAAPVFEELVLRYPKKAYWVQLSLIYGARDNFRGSLAVQQVAYMQGLLTEDKELRRLARSYLYHDLPFRAAEVLSKGLEDGTIDADPAAYELLANSWISAREYESSLPPLVKAAELSVDGNLFMRLGQVYLQREAWLDAAASLEKAVEKGELKNPGNAELLLGIAYYNGDQVAQARSSFERARNHDESRKEAEGWVAHMRRELEGDEAEES